MLALSSRAVPSAMTSPWSITEMVSASVSASSRYCVVSSTVVPSATSVRMTSHMRSAAGGVEAGGRLVEEQHRRVRHQAGGEVEPATHAARVGLDHAVGRERQLELLEQLGGPAAGARARDMSDSSPTSSRFWRPREQLVEGGVLAGDADHPAHRLRVGDHVVAGHPRGAGVGAGHGGEHAHGRGLARRRWGRARRGCGLACDLQRHVGDRHLFAVGLAESLGPDHGAVTQRGGGHGWSLRVVAF